MANNRLQTSWTWVLGITTTALETCPYRIPEPAQLSNRCLLLERNGVLAQEEERFNKKRRLLKGILRMRSEESVNKKTVKEEG